MSATLSPPHPFLSSSNVTSPVKPSRKLQEPPQPSPQLPELPSLAVLWDILVSRARLKDALPPNTTEAPIAVQS